MLYICIPAYNESPTVGLLLWRIRTVFEAHPREYEIIALDDGSTDGTADTLRRYEKVLPLTVLRNEVRGGFGAALDTLARAAAKATRYPRRDAMIVMQGDLTDRPEDLPELAKRFDGGVDCVVAEAGRASAAAPREIRRLRRIAPWLMRRYVRIDGVSDPLGTLRLYRIAVIRDVIKQAGDGP
ncbi:MAG: glycosyltransferase family 2 protein, partial [Gemmatimonadaceae bacterium]